MERFVPLATRAPRCTGSDLSSHALTGRQSRWRIRAVHIWPALLFLAIIVILKAATFGGIDRDVDESFYFLVGQRMHEGVVPYVDVWDRKPFGLFALYYLIAGISRSALAYQLTAGVFAAATAFVVYRLVSLWTTRTAGLLAGASYLFMAPVFRGLGGDPADFYNLLIALAALLLMQDGVTPGPPYRDWRPWLAMALCGVAITIKQTALFESLFLGIWALAQLWKKGAPPEQLAFAALKYGLTGALPTLLIALGYGLAGHWHEYWVAMVTSNLAKHPDPSAAWLGIVVLVRGSIFILCALAGLFLAPDSRVRIFLACWLIAATASILVLRNCYDHYCLPLLLPIAIAAGLMFGARRERFTLFAGLVLFALLWQQPFQRDVTLQKNQIMMELAGFVRAHDPGGGLFVFDGPPALYTLTGERFLSPLVLPSHFNHALEIDVSHLRTGVELSRLLAAGPGVIVMMPRPSNTPINVESRSSVLAYARQNCSTVRTIGHPVAGSRYTFLVFGDCRAMAPAQVRGATVRAIAPS